MTTRWLRYRRERRYWKGLLARLGVPGVTVRDVVHFLDGGYQVYCRSRAGIPDLRRLAGQVAVHKRLPAGSIGAVEG
jgi:hypothetical protein